MTQTLPLELRKYLGSGRPALLISNDPDGFPNTAFTWTLVADLPGAQFIVDIGSGTQRNLDRDPRAALQIIGPDNLIYLLKGQVSCVKARLPTPSLALAHYQLNIHTIKEQAWSGAHVAPISYQWPEQQRQEMQALEEMVFAELRK